jgi:hypothetical protein
MLAPEYVLYREERTDKKESSISLYGPPAPIVMAGACGHPGDNRH